MKIIVCMKQVPATSEVAIDPETGAMKRQSAETRTPDEISYLISTGAGSITLDPFDFDRCFADRNFQGVHKGVPRRLGRSLRNNSDTGHALII